VKPHVSTTQPLEIHDHEQSQGAACSCTPPLTALFRASLTRPGGPAVSAKQGSLSRLRI
jgi:hypothetical protein